ncbi:MAG: hypothetical protein IRY99_25660 [Isosphaeraceae bacterium]|nr:hypothetical protein [Isosphaeraceae bacterium]
MRSKSEAPPSPAVDMITTLDIGPHGLDRYLELVEGTGQAPGPRTARGA